MTVEEKLVRDFGLTDNRIAAVFAVKAKNLP